MRRLSWWMSKKGHEITWSKNNCTFHSYNAILFFTPSFYSLTSNWLIHSLDNLDVHKTSTEFDFSVYTLNFILTWSCDMKPEHPSLWFSACTPFYLFPPILTPAQLIDMEMGCLVKLSKHHHYTVLWIILLWRTFLSLIEYIIVK